LNCFAKSLMVTFSTKCSRLISGMTSIFITPGFSGKKPVIELPGVETFQRFFPQDPGKFCTLINTSSVRHDAQLPAGTLCITAAQMTLRRVVWPCILTTRYACAPTPSKRPASTDTQGSSYIAPLAVYFLYFFIAAAIASAPWVRGTLICASY